MNEPKYTRIEDVPLPWNLTKLKMRLMLLQFQYFEKIAGGEKIQDSHIVRLQVMQVFKEFYKIL